MMAKNPDDRFASAIELSQWLATESGVGGDAGGTARATVLLQEAMKAQTARRRKRTRAWASPPARPETNNTSLR
jgi:hypothetical protein